MSFISLLLKKVFSTRLPYIQILCVFLAFLLTGLGSYAFGVRIEKQHLEQGVEDLFGYIEDQLNADLREMEMMLSVVSQTIRRMLLNGVSLDAIKDYISEITVHGHKEGIPGFLSVFAAFDWPERTGFSGISPEMDWIKLEEDGLFIIEERDWYVLAIEANGETIITEPYVDIVTRETALSYARCIYDDDGNRLATIGLNIMLDRIYNFSFERREYGIHSWMLLDSNLTIIAFPFPEFLGMPLREARGSGIDHIADILEQGLPVVAHRFVNYAGETRIHSIRQLKNGWYMGVSTPVDSYYINLHSIIWFLVVVGLLMTLALSAILLQIQGRKNKAEERSRIMLDSTPLCINFWDKNMNNLDCNQTAVDFFKLKNKQEYLDRFFELSPEFQLDGTPSKDKVISIVQKALDEGYYRCEWMNQMLDGEPIPSELTLVRVKYGNDFVVIVYMRDLREKKRMQRERDLAQDAHQTLQNIFNVLPVAVRIINLEDLSLMYANKAIMEMFNYTSLEDAAGRSVFDFLPETQPDGRSSLEMAKEMMKVDFVSAEVQCKKANGELFYTRITPCKITFKGKPASLAAIENITTAKDELSSLENILDGLDVMIYVTDPKTSKILFINDSMKKHYGIERDCVGELCYKIFQKEHDQKCNFCPCFKLDADPNAVIIWDEHSTLTNRIYRNIDRYIDWPNGKMVHLQHSVDMTELITAKDQAEQSNRSKSIFLSQMSHEIRTPMNAILGIAEIQLQGESLSSETRDAIGKIYESGDLLLKIINDILDLSKIEAGKLELVPVKYDIPSLINDTAQLNRLRYDSKPILFSLQVDENTPHDLFGDELRIKQILNNVLSNAFKYTEEGKVEFYVSAELHDDENITLIFRVSDTGQGMTESQLGKLFDEYSRFNLDTNRTTVGAGLGMTITKRLVNLMNGDIHIESTPGKGTVFTVRLPQKRVNLEICGHEMVEKLRQFQFQSTTMMKKIQFFREYMPYGKVLVVDDVESNIYVTKGMLLPYGLSIDTVTSGLDAVERIRQGNVYDVIFMDHMMPKMDGIEATKIIRGMGYANTIIALTANALIGRAEMFLKNGFDGFISKPIDSRELNFVLNDFIRNKKSPEVINAARQEHHENVQQGTKISEIRMFFIRDAENAVSILTDFYDRIDTLSDDEIHLYTTVVHGMKSALANIGEKDLSLVALKLEKAGDSRNLAVLSEETISFINELRSLIEKLKLEEENNAAENYGDGQASDINLIPEIHRTFLLEKLNEIKTACVEFDKKAAKAVLKELKQKTWPKHINNVLNIIVVNILHSELDEAAALAEKTVREFTL